MRLIIMLCACGLLAGSCASDSDGDNGQGQPIASDWERHPDNPIFRDKIPTEAYEVAGDAHVFFDQQGKPAMVYSGDTDGMQSIKLARGRALDDWENYAVPLLWQVGPSGKDISKETPFYRRTASGKHQIYYIGYENEDTYQSQVYLAEADSLEGPYQQMAAPVIPRGRLAGRDVYLITSPSIVAHEGRLHATFLGWDDFKNVSVVWVIGAVSDDEGHTWQDFKEVDTRIAMEGQVTKVSDSEYYAVRTGEYQDGEALFLSSASHPFGPWREDPEPILAQAGAPWEKDEIIAPQLIFDPQANTSHVFYTGADHSRGWWIMLASKKE